MDETALVLEDFEMARDELRRTMASLFCHTMQTTRLTPMTVLALAAEAVGTVYADIAAAHRGAAACGCGWTPDRSADVECLGRAIAGGTRTRTMRDLRRMPAVGSA